MLRNIENKSARLLAASSIVRRCEADTETSSSRNLDDIKIEN